MGKIILEIILLIFGFVCLIKGADFFVDGAASLAKRLKIPSLIVGLTIVAMGTSAPELAVSISSAMKGSNGLAVSNVIGSNMFNLLVVLGVCSAIMPITVSKEALKRDFPISMGATILFFLFVFNGVLSRWESTILFALIIGYMVMTVIAAKHIKYEKEVPPKFNPLICALCLIGGAAAIVVGGNLVVDNAKAIAISAGMSDTLVGLTICAVGTSLPELVTSVTASKKGENDMAVGNVVGSNIFNILCILGISGMIKPIDLTLTKDGSEINTLIDGGILIAVCIITFIMCLKGKSLSRKDGVIMVIIYLVYMAYIIARNYLLI